MDQIFAPAAWRAAVEQSFMELGAATLAFVPRLMGALVILLTGWILARALSWAVTRGVQWVGVDRAASRRGLAYRLERAGIAAAPSAILGRLIFWVLLLAFLVPAASTLDLPFVNETLGRLLELLPSVFAAILVLFFGLLLGRFTGGVVRSAAGAADLPQASRLGAAAEATVGLLVVFMALQQLGIDAQLVVIALTVLMAVVALTVGATFALAARPVVTHILAGHFLRRSLPPETTVAVGERRGLVERVGATDTLLRDGEHRWSIPNGRLLDEILDR